MPCLFYLLFPSWLHYYFLAWYRSWPLLCLHFAIQSACWSRHTLHWLPSHCHGRTLYQSNSKKEWRRMGGRKKEGRVFVGHSLKGFSLSQPREQMVVGTGWLHCVHDQEAEELNIWSSTRFLSLFPLFISPASQPTRWCHHIQGRPRTSVTLLWRLPHRHTQDCIS